MALYFKADKELLLEATIDNLTLTLSNQDGSHDDILRFHSGLHGQEPCLHSWAGKLDLCLLGPHDVMQLFISSYLGGCVDDAWTDLPLILARK